MSCAGELFKYMQDMQRTARWCPYCGSSEVYCPPETKYDPFIQMKIKWVCKSCHRIFWTS
jgi:transposase-like protein